MPARVTLVRLVLESAPHVARGTTREGRERVLARNDVVANTKERENQWQ